MLASEHASDALTEVVDLPEITFDIGNGTGDIEGGGFTSMSITTDGRYIMEITTPAGQLTGNPAGYVFGGWCDDPSNPSFLIRSGTTSTIVSNEPIDTLYAWYHIEGGFGFDASFITLDPNGGTGGGPTDCSRNYNDGHYTYTLHILGDVPVRDGYTFLGWGTSVDGNSQLLEPGFNSYFLNQQLIETLYAIWEPDVATVLEFLSDPSKGTIEYIG